MPRQEDRVIETNDTVGEELGGASERVLGTSSYSIKESITLINLNLRGTAFLPTGAKSLFARIARLLPHHASLPE